MALPLTLLGLLVAFSFFIPFFFSSQNLSNILVASAPLIILASGAALVIGSGGIDLSIGAILSFSTCLAGALMVKFNVGGEWVIFICLLAGIGVGFMNGLISALTVIPAFIVTIATMSIFRGLSYILTDGETIYGLPPEIIWLGQGNLLNIPNPVILAIISVIVFQIILKKTAFGNHISAYGDNPSATYAMGVNILTLKVKIYALSGLTGALAGLIFMGRLNTIDPTSGQMIEMAAVTAAIIGGVKLSGGQTTIMGAMIGALLIGVVQNGLNLMAISGFYQYIAIGFILLITVVFQPKRIK